MEIDFSRQETEAGWQAVVDNFWLNATPVWFDWLKWIMMLAALLVVAGKSGSYVIQGLTAFSFVAMYFYFTAFFFRIKLKGLPFKRLEKNAFAVSLLLSGLLTAGAAWCAIYLARAVATITK
jgi:hypothetical protein